MSRFLRGLLSAGLCGALLTVSSGASLTAAVVHAPRIVVRVDQMPHPSGVGVAAAASFGWASSNWSGYAVTGSVYTAVTGAWTVPTVTASRRASYSASWIGIDGFNNSDLIQTGTEQDATSGGTHYYAWWEILPAAETQITTFAVHPGDHMTASITKGTSGWTITISDASDRGTFSIVKSYSGPGTSAEWIEEAPTVGGRVATLASYGETTFDPGTANGANPGLVAADGGVMIQGRAQVSTPSGPDSDSDGFNMQYGSTSPAPPAS
jgi:Tfp pilus assembly protein PilW